MFSLYDDLHPMNTGSRGFIGLAEAPRRTNEVLLVDLIPRIGLIRLVTHLEPKPDTSKSLL